MHLLLLLLQAYWHALASAAKRTCCSNLQARSSHWRSLPHQHITLRPDRDASVPHNSNKRQSMHQAATVSQQLQEPCQDLVGTFIPWEGRPKAQNTPALW